MSDNQIAYRFLEPAEYHRLNHLFEQFNGEVPSPELSRVAVAEQGGEIVGFLVFQLVPHTEPMWVDERLRGSRVALKLASMVEPFTWQKGAYLLADTWEVVKIAGATGFEELPHKVYFREPKKEQL